MATRMAAVPIIGHIQEYRPENELLSTYLERVELFFAANDVKDEKQVAAFLSLIGSKTYSILKNLLAPTLPSIATLAGGKKFTKLGTLPKPTSSYSWHQSHGSFVLSSPTADSTDSHVFHLG